MKLQRFHPRLNGYGFAGMHEREDGGFCATKDVEALEAENAALHAECDRLTALIQLHHDSTPAIERAWNRFNKAVSDGPDAPYPGMASAFESYYGQKWNDKGWLRETSVWAAAWKESADRLTAMLTPKDTALSRFTDADGFTEGDPIERLRFFCSLAMDGQDWIDVEPFFSAVVTAMLGPQKVLSAEEVANPGFYWHRYGTEEWCVVDVDFGYPYGRLFIWANGEQDDGLEGQFIGPIKMPEV